MVREGAAVVEVVVGVEAGVALVPAVVKRGRLNLREVKWQRGGGEDLVASVNLNAGAVATKRELYFLLRRFFSVLTLHI